LTQDIIVVKQLPIITEQLRTISDQFKAKTEQALSLICTEETVKTVKEIRSEITKDFNEVEILRKTVKKKILEPYDEFERAYKSYITDVYLPADKQLKNKISEVEDVLKEEKRNQIENYFNEYLISKNIDFINFDNTNISVTLTASLKSLKEQVKAFIDKVVDDVNLINTQEFKEEILVDYKKSLNVSQAIMNVVNRHKDIEAEKVRAEQIRVIEAQWKEASQKVDNITSFSPPKSKSDEIYEATFAVKATQEKLKLLKNFLVNGGYTFDTI
jgi:hypothetical protein